MALPKLDTPVYTLKLPSTQEEIKYRPFLVKEQKLLMMAQEGGEETDLVNTITEIITSCTFNKIDIHEVPLFDIEYIFLKLRSKSVGETATIRVLCPDDNTTYGNVEVNIEEIEVQMTEDHTNIIDLTDKIKIIMKYPQLRDMRGLQSLNASQTQQIFSIMKYCISEVHEGEKIYNRVDVTDEDIEDFIESFSTEQLKSIMNFFETMPKIRKVVKVTNPKTKVVSEVTLEGMETFLE